MLAVIETHPIQYHAPLYRLLEQRFGVPVTAIYASDFSVRGYRDAEFGATFAWTLYGRANKDPLPARLGALSRAMRERFYFDEIYQFLIRVTHEAVAGLAGWADRWIIAGLGVRGVSGATDIAGRLLRLVQSGNLQTYAFLMVAGLVVVLVYALK